MLLYTHNTDEIWVDEDFLNNYAREQCGRKIDEVAQKINECAFKLNSEIENYCSEWIKIESRDIYYIHKHRILIPDITTFNCSLVNENKFENSFSGFEGRIINEREVYDLFIAGKNTNVFFADNIWFTANEKNFCVLRYLNKDASAYECINTQGNRSCSNKNLSYNCHNCSWGYGIKLPVYQLNGASVIENFVVNSIIPEPVSVSAKTLIKMMSDLYSSGYILFRDGKIEFTEKFLNDVMNNKVDSVFGVSFENTFIAEDMKQYAQHNILEADDKYVEMLSKKFLRCDTILAEIEEYDEKRLSDPNEGIWELWGDEQKRSDRVKIRLNRSFVARNPLADVKEDGIVGIDFGTKSTIVVFQNGNDTIMPMRIGIGNLSLPVSPEQYENPTVLEIKNLENFLREYKSKEGRPETEWNDMTVSHTAFRNMTSSTVSDDFYSYFYDLKQWSANTDKYRIVTIKDQCENEYELYPYISDNNNLFDPIELYAYYLGLYINNIRNGIYLDYLLSFPITYEKKLRDKILSSFERGLKKSLPETIINDKYCMDIFSVTQGVSEPVAYAITAFTEFGIKPLPGQEYLYGVFDFGGGTTDFNFGTYRMAEQDEKKKYDYVISHMGSGGDKYLGGENLLELLAFEIFKANMNKLLKRKDFSGIVFTIPEGCQTFLGAETLISGSQKAKRNTKQLMEKLRPFWENFDYYQHESLSIHSDINNPKSKKVLQPEETRTLDQISKGFIKVDLFDNSGTLIRDFELDIVNDKNEINLDLSKILENRIEQGVKQFFNSLSNSFSHKKLIEDNGIEIFLAGNSGKSPILRKLFEKYTMKFSEMSPVVFEPELFHIYPSLGTQEAVNIQRRNGIFSVPGELSGPTGKTGVAYGLIKGRTGSRIKIVSHSSETNGALFKYYLGHCEEERFICDINKNISYNTWTEFACADETRIEMYFTDLPEAELNTMPITNLNKKIIRVKQPDSRAYIYIRVTSSSSAEYVIAYREGIRSENYLSDIYRITF